MSRLADLEAQAHKLLSNHTAITILDVLGREGTLRDTTLATDREAVTDALALLGQMGLVDPGPPGGTSPVDRAVTLTPRGQSMADLLVDILHPE